MQMNIFEFKRKLKHLTFYQFPYSKFQVSVEHKIIKLPITQEPDKTLKVRIHM